MVSDVVSPLTDSYHPPLKVAELMLKNHTTAKRACM